MIVLIIALSIILGIGIGIGIGRYFTQCEFGRILYLLEKSGQLKCKEVTSDEKGS